MSYSPDESENFKRCRDEAVALFSKRFGGEPAIAVSAPGRVNLIGEHTDYNDGFVLPMALPLMTVIVGRKLESGNCRIVTGSEDDIPEDFRDQAFPVPQHQEGEPLTLVQGPGKWVEYVKGVVALMNERVKGGVPPFEAVVTSCVPLGKGVSSSASLEVATALFVEELLGGSGIGRTDLALICQNAEHLYAGSKCGIMDQFISLMAKEGNALKIDCEDKSCECIPLMDPSLAVLVVDTGVKHQLADKAAGGGGVEGQYNERRSTCEEAARKLKEHFKLEGKSSLRHVTMEQLKGGKEVLTELEYRRARHVISEIKRTEDAVDALKGDKYEDFGKLMNDSHTSLRDDYDVSCPQLDELVEIIMKESGVYGSRMTGGGFGGCTATLLQKDAVSRVKEQIKREYSGYSPDLLIMEASASRGASKRELFS